MSKGINLGIALVLASALILTGFVGSYMFSTDKAYGSVNVGSDYKSRVATSSAASASSYITLKTGPGSLANITVGSSSPITALPQIRIYDSSISTTTSSSTLFILGSNNQTPGTYTVDAQFYAGLIMEVTSGFNGAVTVTYR